MWLGQVSHRVAMSVCLSVCLSVRAIAKHTLPGVLETSGLESAGEGVLLWLLAVGCWLLVLPWHFNGSSMALQRHFNGT